MCSLSSAKTPNTDLAPIGDDTESIAALCEEVEMGNDEDEEPIGTSGSQSNNESEESHESERSKNMKIQLLAVVVLCPRSSLRICITIATRSSSTSAPWPVPRGSQFCVVPFQLRSTDHYGAFQNSVRP